MEIHVIPHFHECQSVMDISKLRLTSMTVEHFPVGDCFLIALGVVVAKGHI